MTFVLLYIIAILIIIIIAMYRSIQAFKSEIEQHNKVLIETLQELDTKTSHLNHLSITYSRVCDDNRKMGRLLTTSYPYEKDTQKLPKLPLDY